MKRSPPAEDAPPLFDLPLTGPSDSAGVAETGGPLDAEDAENMELFEGAPAGEAIWVEEQEPSIAEPHASAEPRQFSLTQARLRAGGLDLGVAALVLLVMLAGTWAMGVPVRVGALPAYALTLAVFSFLYMTIPLAFWGQTPGMARIGLVARSGEHQPLTFGQTFLRWLGAVLTTLLLGLPALLLPTGRSLADRLSGSAVRRRSAR